MVRDAVANVVNALWKAGFAPRKVGLDAWEGRARSTEVPATRWRLAAMSSTMSCSSAGAARTASMFPSFACSGSRTMASTRRPGLSG